MPHIHMHICNQQKRLLLFPYPSKVGGWEVAATKPEALGVLSLLRASWVKRGKKKKKVEITDIRVEGEPGGS